MPLYEYKCLNCEKIHEVMQKFSDPHMEKCEDCGGTVTKLMSLSSFALKGSGWYTTDYKRAAAPSSQPSSGGEKPEAKPEGKTEGKSEAKPESNAAAKTETKTEGKAEPKASPAPKTEGKSGPKADSA